MIPFEGAEAHPFGCGFRPFMCAAHTFVRIFYTLVWRVNDEAIDWFVLQGGEYILAKAENGILRSRTFPGLWLAAEALLNGDLAAVLETVRQGAASPEHAAFVQSLSKR